MDLAVNIRMLQSDEIQHAHQLEIKGYLFDNIYIYIYIYI